MLVGSQLGYQLPGAPVPSRHRGAIPSIISTTLSEPTECQPHCELVASVKLLTELTTLAASLVTVAICAAEGLDDKPATELFSASTDDLMALVWSGKSLLAELTSAVALLWTVATCDFKPLTPLLTFKLVSPLTEVSRLVRSAQ